MTEKDKTIKKTVVVEINITARTNSEKYFETVLKERIKDLCLDIWSGECKTGYSVSITTRKSKLIEIKEHPGTKGGEHR